MILRVLSAGAAERAPLSSRARNMVDQVRAAGLMAVQDYVCGQIMQSRSSSWACSWAEGPSVATRSSNSITLASLASTTCPGLLTAQVPPKPLIILRSGLMYASRVGNGAVGGGIVISTDDAACHEGPPCRGSCSWCTGAEGIALLQRQGLSISMHHGTKQHAVINADLLISSIALLQGDVGAAQQSIL